MAAGLAVRAWGVAVGQDARAERRKAEGAPLAEQDVAEWTELAKTFGANVDFKMPNIPWREVLADWYHDGNPYRLFNAIRYLSPARKAYLSAMEDKALMHDAIARIPGIQQMPNLFVYQEGDELAQETLDALAAKLRGLPFVIKPTHLSDSAGFKAFPGGHAIAADQLKAALLGAAKTPRFDEVGRREASAVEPPHVGAEEVVRPGAVLQPEYPPMDFDHSQELIRYRKTKVNTLHLRKVWLTAPIELRVQVVWGRAYIVLYRTAGEGAADNAVAVTPQRGSGGTLREAVTWPCQPRVLMRDDFHREIYQVGKGLEDAMGGWATSAIMDKQDVQSLCDGIRPHLRLVVTQAEEVARQLEAPWLRVDFFVPPPKLDKRWPVVLNEVEYNQGLTFFKYRPQDPVDVGSEIEDQKAAEHWCNEASRRAQGELIDLLVMGWAKRHEQGQEFFPRWHALDALGCKSSSGTLEPLAKYRSVSCKPEGQPSKWWESSLITKSTKWWDEGMANKDHYLYGHYKGMRTSGL
uniref:ATP-grasp domain-containing protein n=1 Tax=Zooxanthella nutricula TaxID=1333877 RepID=A0A7S2Q5F4_9DINO